MAAGIAHEIRNPLTGIHGYLYAMDEMCAELPPEEPAGMLRATIDKIRKAAGKMESVIRRVLDFSKPGTPRLELLDLATPVQEALSLLAPTLRKAGVSVLRLRPSPASARPHAAGAGGQHRRQPARAIASPGTKSASTSASKRRIRVSLTRRHRSRHPPRHLERIFDPFTPRPATARASACHRAAHRGRPLRVIRVSTAPSAVPIQLSPPSGPENP
jgi:light-regulated signal transduction histidine kinase (bacteriophytochrome)